MTRRGVPEEVNWFLKEWMDADPRFRGRGGQARMMEATGWSRATMSQLYNGKQDYSPNVVNQAAKALGVGPWELLMHPETAIALRPFVRALQPPPAPPPESPPAADHKPERRRAGGKKH